MSALAARRAAAEASASASPAVTPPPATPAVKESRLNGPSSPTVRAQSSEAALRGAKRRRVTAGTIEQSQVANHRAGNNGTQATPSARSRPIRRFSPGAPVSDEEDDSVEEIADLSASSEGFLDEMRDLKRANGSTPKVQDALGEPTAVAFVPRRGANLVVLSSEELQAAGLDEGSGVLISLTKDEVLALSGMYRILPLRGSISVYGATLTPTTDPSGHPVFAPASHPVPPIKAASSLPDCKVDNTILSRLSLPSTFLLPVTENTTTAVFLVLEHHCGLEGLGRGAVPGFAHIWGQERGDWGLRGVHFASNETTSLAVLASPASWSTALHELEAFPEARSAGSTTEPDVLLVRGPKSVGKSSFARMALNSLLAKHKKVAWLECDLGQAEMCPGGVIGLWVVDEPVLGPPFTHPRPPFRAHYLGTYSPLTCPDEYIGAIQHLLDVYRFEVRFPEDASSGGIPLIINTQGWIKGLGAELLQTVQAMSGANRIYDFDDAAAVTPGDRPTAWTESPAWNAVPLPATDAGTSTGTSREVINTILEPAPISPITSRHAAADLRALWLISYFHQRSHVLGGGWDFQNAIRNMDAWEVMVGPKSGLESIYLIGEGSQGVMADDLPLALDGSIVALVDAGRSEVFEDAYEPYVQSRAPPPLDDTHYIGLALVRATRPTVDGLALQLVTPLSATELGRATAIIRNGAIELPTCGLLDWTGNETSSRGGNEAPFLDDSGVEAVGLDKRRIRRNLQRRGV